MSDDLLALFRQTGALIDGHFVLRSGLHNRQFFQCALLLPHTRIAEMNVETFEADNLPVDLARIPAIKPGSK